MKHNKHIDDLKLENASLVVGIYRLWHTECAALAHLLHAPGTLLCCEGNVAFYTPSAVFFTVSSIVASQPSQELKLRII